MLHTPLVQVIITLGGDGHFMPQPPQWRGSLPSPVSQPLFGILSQSPQPASHLPMPHTLFAQPATACGVLAQLFPQLPQLDESTAALISHPSWSCPLQSLYPGAHTPTTQAPPRQSGLPLGMEQALPQAPQLLTSLLIDT